jgi:hypothetical protein
MLIVWGKRITRTNMGRADWFCPMCRAVERHALVQVRQCSHVYFISMGAGRPLFAEAACEACGLATRGEPLIEADRARSERPMGSPELPESILRRLELEERLLDGRVAGPERAWLIAEPIAALEHSDRTGTRKPGESVNALIGLGTIIAVFAAVIVVFDQGWSALGIGLTAVAAAFLALWVWHTARMNRQRADRRSAGRLAAPLEILEPTEQELEQAFASLAAKGFVVAKQLQPPEILREIERRAHTMAAREELATG